MTSTDSKPNADGHRLFELLFGPKLAKRYTDAYAVRPDSFQDLVFGKIGPMVWFRDGLDLRTKLVTMIVIFATTAQDVQFKIFCRSALIHGITPQEIEELLLLVGLEAGMPRAANALDWLTATIAEHEAFLAEEGSY
ncbi:carboxymuconolactone decarboxylase family protein [Novosphingobium kaempferiae]|uniref:carboxymuconolactone decarboxylase family protein n=1 Tax=Novosphingobium kaempferiae TaxID=2896849 RepID=UPI001E37FF5E|nr:carboxymuconolactone decarboxylase family protein [Novosphingobium kaempferiae]